MIQKSPGDKTGDLMLQVTVWLELVSAVLWMYSTGSALDFWMLQLGRLNLRGLRHDDHVVDQEQHVLGTPF